MTEVLEFFLFCGTGRLCGPHGTATSFNATSMLAATRNKRKTCKENGIIALMSGQVKRTHGYAWYHPREPNAMLNTHRGHVSSCPSIFSRTYQDESGGGGEAAARRQRGDASPSAPAKSNGKALSGTAARGPKRLRVARLWAGGARTRTRNRRGGCN